MAHELEINQATGKYEMAYTGDAPWHRLGNHVTKGASISKWMKEGGFLWTAEEMDLTYQPRINGKLRGNMITSLGKLITRSDTGEELAIVGPGYNVVQPRDCMEFFRDLTEEEGWHIETAGVLRGGRKLWVQASRDELTGLVSDKDRVYGRLLLATSLDGSLKTTCALVAERVVCRNTLDIALAQGQMRGSRIEVSHRSVFDARAIKRKMGLVSGAWDKFIKQARELADYVIPEAEAVEILRKIFGTPKTAPAVDRSWMSFGSDAQMPQQEDEEEERDGRNVERALALWQGEGMGSEDGGSKDTCWGLLNAVTELVDHEMGRTDDTRVDSAWFGRGKDYKTEAFRLLSTLVEA